MTEIEYIEALDVASAKMAGHALMPTLLKGYSKVNVIYLKHLMKQIPPPAQAPVAEEVAFDVKRLLVQKSKLFGQRASLSNKMCDLPDEPDFDKKRAKYSDDIQAVQRDIEQVMRDIEAAERGEMREMPAPDLPTSEADMIRRLASLRASRSRQRAKEKTAKGKKLEQCRMEQKRLEKLIIDVETALAQHH